MANSVKLSNGDFIDTSGIYDSAKGKTQAEINSNSDFLLLTGGTLSENNAGIDNIANIGIKDSANVAPVTGNAINIKAGVNSPSEENLPRSYLKLESPVDNLGVRITNVAAPTSDTDAATKAYVDLLKWIDDYKAMIKIIAGE